MRLAENATTGKKSMPAVKAKKKKEPTITVQKKKLWPVFSRYIRMRDCLATTKSITHGKCCTCGRLYPIGKLQAGHFIPGRQDSVLFEPTCVHAQCYRCNVQRQGEWVKYFRFMEEKYGQAEIFRLMALSEEVRLITPEWVANSMQYYKHHTEVMELEARAC